jgi:polar amino acid transport system substrate-binding protein
MSAGQLLAVAALVWLAGACSTAPASPSAEARAALAPAGMLRVAINLGNPVLARRDDQGEITGVSIDLGRALAARLGAAFVPVVYPNAGALVAGARAGAWSVGFAAVDPARADVLEFTAPYMEVSVTYLVAARSPIRTVADADGQGVRIAVGTGNAADLFLSRTARQARLVRIPDTLEAAIEIMQANQADAYAGTHERLLILRERLGEHRILDDRFHAVEHAIAVPRGRAPSLAYARVFVEEMKASGAIAEAIARHGLRGVTVAPRATR